ncbi:MAG TPA: ABC transporter permease [Dehalococcoidia bacterium]|jgi:peptide/nickel transport system permease protein|nr:ABC transporter permease [Dehalococcoidia bacterium]
MATAIQTRTIDEVLREPPKGGPIGWLHATGTFCRRKPLGAIGALIIVLMVIAALFVDASLFGSDEPLLAPQHYNEQKFGDENLSPSADHVLGTDQLGRDIFSRILYGARISMIIGLGVVLFTAVVSLAIGTVSGFFTGWIDTVIQRIVDIFLAIPPLILLIYGLSVFAGRAGPYTKMFWIIIIVGVVLAAASIRVVRGAAIATANNPYVDAARTLGASNARIVFRHVMPNVFPVVIVLASVQLGTAILAEAAISFLGLGIPEPFPSWGTMLGLTGSSQFRAYPLQAVWPGLAVAIAVWGFNMFGDALRDVLDPRLRGSR